MSRNFTGSCPSRPPPCLAMPPRHVLAAVLVAVAWGVNFVVIHVGLEHFPPLLFAALRFTLVALALPFVPRPGVPARWVIGVGIFMSAGQFGLLFVGMDRGVSAGLASLVLQLQAAFTVALAVALLGERPRRAQLAGGALALGGIGVIAGGRAQAAPLGALALVVGAALSWGVGNICARQARAPHQPIRAAIGSSQSAQRFAPLSLLVWSSLVPPLPLLALSLAIEGPGAAGGAFAALDPAGVLALLYVVGISTFGGYGVWTALMARHPASQVAPFTLLVPPVGIVAAWVALGEVPGVVELAGAAIVLAGVALTLLTPRAGAAAAWRAARARPIGRPLRTRFAARR
jgi:O-acetylserine/cysteine efflux transporter